MEYQMLIGCLNYKENLGRLDVYCATSTLVRYAQSPRNGIRKSAYMIFKAFTPKQRLKKQFPFIYIL